MKELVTVSEDEEFLAYRKLVSQRGVAEIVYVLVRITVQRPYVRTLTLARVHNRNQHFRHVSCN